LEIGNGIFDTKDFEQKLGQRLGSRIIIMHKNFILGVIG
jgi:hypothetical protein